jgi:hypothetical protein
MKVIIVERELHDTVMMRLYNRLLELSEQSSKNEQGAQRIGRAPPEAGRRKGERDAPLSFDEKRSAG